MCSERVAFNPAEPANTTIQADLWKRESKGSCCMSEQRPSDRDRQPGKSKNGRNPLNAAGNGMRFGRGFFGWFLFIALAVMLFMLLQKGSTSYYQIPFSEFSSRLQADAVKTLTIDGDKIMGEFRKLEAIDDQQVGKFQTPLPAGSSQSWELMRWVDENHHNAKVLVEDSPN